MSGFTFPRAFPTHKNVRDIKIRARKVVGVNTSPGSLIAQTYEWPGERWEAEFSLPLMSRADGAPWAAWLISLRGPVGSFLMGDKTGAAPLGAAAANAGTPQVDGAQLALARVLNIKTGLGAVAGWLLAGSFLSLGTGASRRLHMVMADAALNSSGKATLDIWPALRANVANNDTVYLTNTTAKFMLATSAPDYTIDTSGRYQPATISCVEDLRP